MKSQAQDPPPIDDQEAIMARLDEIDRASRSYPKHRGLTDEERTELSALAASCGLPEELHWTLLTWSAPPHTVRVVCSTVVDASETYVTDERVKGVDDNLSEVAPGTFVQFWLVQLRHPDWPIYLEDQWDPAKGWLRCIRGVEAMNGRSHTRISHAVRDLLAGVPAMVEIRDYGGRRPGRQPGWEEKAERVAELRRHGLSWPLAAAREDIGERTARDYVDALRSMRRGG